MIDKKPIYLGVSACLLGQKVRFNGQHTRNHFVANDLSAQFKLLPVCPEAAIGLGIPRPAMRLQRHADEVALRLSDEPDRDISSIETKLTGYADQVVTTLSERISGFIFKKGSPSCGVERVKVYDANGVPNGSGQGIFSRTVRAHLPALPVEEEGRLNDPVLRQNFLDKVMMYFHWQQEIANSNRTHDLIQFHAYVKYALLARSQSIYRELGRLVAGVTAPRLAEVKQAYLTKLMQGMSEPLSRGKQTNVLHHMMGYLKNHLDRQDKQELLQLIEAYRLGKMPLHAPMSLMRHHFRKNAHPYIERQFYYQADNY